jgi:hypothetical protein
MLICGANLVMERVGEGVVIKMVCRPNKFRWKGFVLLSEQGLLVTLG